MRILKISSARPENTRWGLCISHQNLSRFDHRLRGAVHANTSIKMVGGLSGDDIRAMAREMNGEVAFLQSIRKHMEHTEFACMVRNELDHPVRITVKLGQLEAMPKNPQEGVERLREQNRARYCTSIYHTKGVDPADQPPMENRVLPWMIRSCYKRVADYIRL